MCGICGMVDFERPVEADGLTRMTSVLRHRGPDEDGQRVLGPAGLGFRRLSIIDLESSHQPMANEDESVWMVFNGEIYNYRDLRPRLEATGHRFRTRGDGETILHLYEEHGLDFVHHLNGMFAVALWDAARERLVLARDRLGIKPLYYALEGGRLLFASETKSILQILATRTLDHAAVAGYMNYSSVPGRRTCFREVARLLPGFLAVHDRSGFREQRYWDVSFESKRSWEKGRLEDEIEEVLRDAVRLRMISDVPLGAFLSGGVDSSLIAALMAGLGDRPVQAFSIGYGKEGAFLNETDYARRVAERHGMVHRGLVLDSEDLLRDLETVAWHLDEPCGDPAAFLTLALSAFTREHVTVSLSGLGADELFGGYRRYLALGWQERYRHLPGWLRRGLLEPLLRALPESRTSLLGDRVRLMRKLIDSVGEDLQGSWRRTVSYLPRYEGPVFSGEMASAVREDYTSEAFEEYWTSAASFPDPADRVMYMDLKMYMHDQLLMLQDKMSMAVSLEARVPFLDHRVVELAASIPVGAKLEGGVLKTLLKRVAERHVPRECIYRPKKGFAAPVEAWLRGPLRERVHEALSPARVEERGIFDPAFAAWLLREFYRGGRDLTMQVYQAFLLEVWLRLYLDAEGPPPAREPLSRPATS